MNDIDYHRKSARNSHVQGGDSVIKLDKDEISILNEIMNA